MRPVKLPDLEFFLQAETLGAFRGFPAYRDLEPVPLVGELRRRWQELCQERVRSVSGYLDAGGAGPSQASEKGLDRLDEIRVERDGRHFVLNGVVHGILGGGTSAYRHLIQATLRESQDPLLFEAGFNHLYGEKGLDYVSIPDFAVLGFADSCKKGLDAGRLFPILIKDAIMEFFSLMPEDTPYHLLDQEQRRGLFGVLPTPLEIEWDAAKPKPLLTFEDYPNLVRRSAFMVAFAEAWCRKNNRSGCRLVMGDFHLTEAAYFLRHPEKVPEDLRHLAETCTSEYPRTQTLIYLKENLFHNTVGGIAGFVGFLPYFLAVLGLQVWYFGS